MTERYTHSGEIGADNLLSMTLPDLTDTKPTSSTMMTSPPPTTTTTTQTTTTTTVLLFYQYFSPTLTDPQVQQLVHDQQQLCARLQLTGRVLISEQGVNGTLAGTTPNTTTYEHNVEHYHNLFTHIQWKRSPATTPPFPDLRVRRVKEIVSSGNTLPWHVANPQKGGLHLTPQAFHNVLEQARPDDNLVILDVRNRWEHAVGHFTDAAGRAAVHPNMRNFTQVRHTVGACWTVVGGLLLDD